MSESRLVRELKVRMQDSGYNQKSLALAADLNETYVRDILKGKSKNPQSVMLARIANALGCTVDDLVGNATLDGGNAELRPASGSPKRPSDGEYSESERAIIELWRELTPAVRDRVVSLLETLVHDANAA